MSIKTKIVLGFTSIYAIVIFIAVIFFVDMRREMRNYLGANLVTLAEETADKIDRDIFYHMNTPAKNSEALLDLNEVKKIIDKVRNGMSYQNCYIELIDKEGLTWFRNDYKIGTKRPSGGSAAAIANEGKSGFIIESITRDGNPYLRAFGYSKGYSYYKGPGWSVIINVAVDEVFAPIGALTGHLASVFATGLLIAILIGTLLALSVLKPLGRLRRGVNVIAGGNMDHKVATGANDEIGHLSGAFDDMITALKKITVSRSELEREHLKLKWSEKNLRIAYKLLKETQKELFQSAKMASIGMLSGGIAHEINNPLTSILNNAELLKVLNAKGQNADPDELKSIINSIEESALRCEKTVKALLNFARTSTGALQPISINSVVLKAMVLLEHEISVNNIKVEKELAHSMPLVLGDSQLLQQVVFDIMINAIWAINKNPAKGEGLITVRTVYDKKNKLVLLEISDTGIGISPEGLDKIFQPFFSTKHAAEGSGLGLPIAYNIIRSHKGDINVKSAEGKGTSFRISIPVYEE